MEEKTEKKHIDYIRLEGNGVSTWEEWWDICVGLPIFTSYKTRVTDP